MPQAERIFTLHPVTGYSDDQISQGFAVAEWLDRGAFFLTTRPNHDCGAGCELCAWLAEQED